MKKYSLFLIAVLILCFALASAATCQSEKEAQYVDKDELRKIIGDTKVVIIDVRRISNEFTMKPGKTIFDELPEFKGKIVASGQLVAGPSKPPSSLIKGAVWKDPDKVSSWGPKLNKKKRIILYGENQNEADSLLIGEKLKAMGFSNVSVLKGGFIDWKNAGYPMVKKK
jgi:rhodanese-related sulfurtransferase